MSIDLSAANWYKSSRSSSTKECVEIAHLSEGLVGVRDSKDQQGAALVFTPGEWDSFVASVQSGTLG